MSSGSTTSYDVSWQGWHQVFSSFSGLFFVSTGLFIGFRLYEPGTVARFLGVLCVNKGLAAFWNHATNEAILELRYWELSAQLWLLNQIFVWVVVPREPLFYTPRILAGVLAAICGGNFFSEATWWAVVLCQIGSILLVMFLQEWYYRRRWLGLGCLVAMLAMLVVAFLLRNNPAIFLGQFGACWVHVTQMYVLVTWFVFWSQRYERLYGCGDCCVHNDTMDTLYCC